MSFVLNEHIYLKEEHTDEEEHVKIKSSPKDSDVEVVYEIDNIAKSMKNEPASSDEIDIAENTKDFIWLKEEPTHEEKYVEFKPFVNAAHKIDNHAEIMNNAPVASDEIDFKENLETTEFIQSKQEMPVSVFDHLSGLGKNKNSGAKQGLRCQGIGVNRWTTTRTCKRPQITPRFTVAKRKVRASCTCPDCIQNKCTFTQEDVVRYLHEDSDSDGEDTEGSVTEDVLEAQKYDLSEDDLITPSLGVIPVSNNREIHQPGIPSPSNTAEVIEFNQRVLHGRNKYIWCTEKRTRNRTPASNLINMVRGPTPQCKAVTDPLSCFEMFITDNILNEIIRWTNVEIAVQQNDEFIRSTQNASDKTEMKAFIGLLVLTAVLKDNHLSTNEIFDSSYCGSRYISTMSKERFDFLLRCLRFDDKSIRLKMQNNDRFTPIRKVWSFFVEKCQTNYNPGLNVTIGEQFLAFNGRCPFRMYVPDKPEKHGLKIVTMCDNDTKYMLNAIPHLGENIENGGLSLSEYFVKEITKTIHGSNRNVTMDSRFASIPLAKSLLCEPYKLTMVGNLHPNKKEIPKEMTDFETKQIGSSMLCYDDALTLLSYKSKSNNVEYFLSSLAEEQTVNEANNKSNIMEYYNRTKRGVDAFDRMCNNMSCSRKTNRWPLCLFYGMLNAAFINSYVIYCHNKIDAKETPSSRKHFLKELHSKLVSPLLEKRLIVPILNKKVKTDIQNMIAGGSQDTNETPERDHSPKKRKICGICSYKKHRMTKSKCSKCHTSICGEHKIVICINCS